MEYGGITPIGVPDEWPIFVDKPILNCDQVVNMQARSAKLLISTKTLAALEHAEIVDITKE